MVLSPLHRRRAQSPNRSVPLALLLLVCSSAQAAEFHAGERYSLPPGETVSQNLYAAAGDVIVAGNVDGDLVAAGREVLLQGTVSQDALVAAGRINIVGRVLGDVRTAGGEILVSGPVGGDLIVAGRRVQVFSSTVVEGDAAVAGGQLFFGGTLRRSLTATGGSVTINGEITGPVRVRAGSLTIGANTVLSNGLTYWSETEARIDPSARINGPVVFHQTAGRESISRMVRSLWIALVIAAFLGLFVAVVLAFALLRSPSQILVRHTVGEFGYDFLIGFLVFILAPVLLGALAFTVVGLPLSLLGAFVYLAFGVVAMIFAGMVFGSLAFGRSAGAIAPASWKTVLLGFVVLFLIGLIPVIGTLVYAVFALAVFGSLFHMLWRRTRTHAA